jgi:hypothetical protein
MSVNIDTPARLAVAAILALALLGCADRGARDSTTPPPETPPSKETPADEVAAERAKLNPEDRALVDAQEWCVISTNERLGSMGPPVKLTIKGQPVFVCCKGCVRKAEANPDATLTTAAELKSKAERAKAGPP